MEYIIEYLGIVGQEPLAPFVAREERLHEVESTHIIGNGARILIRARLLISRLSFPLHQAKAALLKHKRRAFSS